MARNEFVDALKLFLDTADPEDLEHLAGRLKPYRISSLQVQKHDGSRSIPVIVLDGQAHNSQLDILATNVFPDTSGLPSALSTPSVEPPLDFSLPWSPASIAFEQDQLLFDMAAQAASCGAITPDNVHNFGMEEIGQLGQPYCEMILGERVGEFPTLPVNSMYNTSPITLPITPPQSEFFDSPVGSCSPDQFGTTSPELPVCAPNQPTALHENYRKGSSNLSQQHAGSVTTHAIVSNPSPAASVHVPGRWALTFSNCIRRDYLDFVRSNLPHWIKDGLWTAVPCPSLLDTRIETDQVRKRVALVMLHSQYMESYRDWKSLEGRKHRGMMAVGRGDMTLMIDGILRQTTPAWAELDARKRLQLRALFHERKRYGKRWSVFRTELGASILLVCSTQLANMVSNTKVTMAALKEISQSIRQCAPVMSVLRILEPLAEGLINNDPKEDLQADHILKQCENLQHFTAGQAVDNQA
ncbi:Aurovertin biosynthesis cluster transcription factor aurF [Paramyrothecium foliicola]|nr:Aurovertin biosynthesis cluster transcription factor aurF [Paramyrothecium foliicola]